MSNEGLIQYRLAFTQKDFRLPKIWQKLDLWRRPLVLKHVLGQDPNRYQNLGFGNISVRTGTGSFIITASQTGHIANLKESHYCHITDWDIDNNCISATGVHPPSSEALTHAQIYQLDHSIQAVFHGHSPIIWNSHKTLGLATTQPHIEYGTVLMAKEFARLKQENKLKQGKIVVLLGHEDGFISFGKTLDEAGQPIIELLNTL